MTLYTYKEKAYRYNHKLIFYVFTPHKLEMSVKVVYFILLQSFHVSKT